MIKSNQDQQQFNLQSSFIFNGINDSKKYNRHDQQSHLNDEISIVDILKDANEQEQISKKLINFKTRRQQLCDLRLKKLKLQQENQQEIRISYDEQHEELKKAAFKLVMNADGDDDDDDCFLIKCIEFCCQLCERSDD